MQLTRYLKNTVEIKNTFENIKHELIRQGFPETELDSSINSILHLEDFLTVFAVLVIGAGLSITLILLPLFFFMVSFSFSNYLSFFLLFIFAVLVGFLSEYILEIIAYPPRFRVLAGVITPLFPIVFLFLLLGFYGNLKFYLARIVNYLAMQVLAGNIYGFQPINSLVYGFLFYFGFNIFIIKSVLQEGKNLDLLFYAVGPLFFIFIWIVTEYAVRSLGGSLA